MASQKIFRTFLLLGSLLGIFYFMPAKAEDASGERILSFVSEIHINTDASAEVTETIKIVARQQQIRHGIYRILVTDFRDSTGLTHKLTYQVRQVSLGSASAPFHLGSEQGGLAIYIGSKDKVLERGTYTYVLRYHVTNVVTFLSKEDEFHWNITGNQWTFPIEEVQADIYLPEDTTITHYTAYTGVAKEKRRDFSTFSSGANELSYKTTSALQPGEGLTIALAWPKGIVHQSAEQAGTKQAFTLEQGYASFIANKGNFISLQILILLILYYGFVWYWEAREPREGTIIPLFEPPPGLSAAGMRYISEMDYDFKTFSTALVSLATAGILTIQEDEGVFSLIKKSDDYTKVSSAEQGLAERLFWDHKALVLNAANSVIMNYCARALKKALKKEFENVYFITHAVYLIPGFILGILALVATLRASGVGLDNLYSSVLLIGIFAWLFYQNLEKNRYTLIEAYQCPSFSNISSAIFNALILVVVAGLGLLMLWGYSSVISSASIALLITIIFVNLAFYHLLKVHTPQGRKLMDKIEGFKMFLSATERARFESLNPPEKTPALFEKYLPYALALDVENSWSRQFTQVLQRAGIENQPYHPTWYVGRGWTTNNPETFSNYLSVGMAFALAQSASMGGGGSGGGGGGGGGGGW